MHTHVHRPMRAHVYMHVQVINVVHGKTASHMTTCDQLGEKCRGEPEQAQEDVTSRIGSCCAGM